MILGVCGAAGTGKTTLATRLVEKYGYEIINFADPLKDLCSHLFDWERERLDDWVYKAEQDPNLPAGWTRRRVLQHIGTEGLRAIDPEFWLKQAKHRIVDAASRQERANPRVVLPDMRFLNEAKMVASMNGKLIRVAFPPGVGHALGKHESEAEWQRLIVDLEMQVTPLMPPGIESVDALALTFNITPVETA